MSATHRAWAIDLSLKGHPWPCWLGILGPGDEPARHLRGCRTALWQTRREAQDYLRDRKLDEGTRADGSYYWRHAAVRAVRVSVASSGPAPRRPA